MSQCTNCQADNLTDSPLCPTCASVYVVKHRDNCDCKTCGAQLAQLVEINALNDVPTVAAVRRQSISRSTRIIGNYAYFPEFGWRRYVTLASATWNQYMY